MSDVAATFPAPAAGGHPHQSKGHTTMNDNEGDTESLKVREEVFFNNPIIREAMKGTLLARPARVDDETSDVLVLGRDFHYLITRDGWIHKTSATGPGNAPDRVIVDADSFLSGLEYQFKELHSIPQEGLEYLGIRSDNNQVFRVIPTA